MRPHASAPSRQSVHAARTMTVPSAGPAVCLGEGRDMVRESGDCVRGIVINGEITHQLINTTPQGPIPNSNPGSPAWQLTFLLLEQTHASMIVPRL